MKLCNKSAAVMVGAILAMSLAAMATAQNRFSSADGGAVGGEGTFGSGTVTVHHNLLEEEKEEILNLIEQLNLELQQMKRAHMLEVDSLNNEITQLKNAGKGTIHSYVRSFRTTMPSCNQNDILVNKSKPSPHSLGGSVICLSRNIR